MKKTSKLFLAVPMLLLGICCCGCMDKCKTEVLRNYITEYSVSRDFQLFSDLSENDLFEIKISGEGIVSHRSEGEKLETFNKLATKNGDVSYYEKIECANLSPLPIRTFFSESISKINITCDKNIDATHPAGVSLNDLFLFLSFSPDKYLKNGYKPLDFDAEKELAKVDKRLKRLTETAFNSSKSSELVYGKLSEIDFSKHKLLWITESPFTCAVFCWITPPSNISNYTLTVEISFTDGVKKTANILVK